VSRGVCRCPSRRAPPRRTHRGRGQSGSLSGPPRCPKDKAARAPTGAPASSHVSTPSWPPGCVISSARGSPATGGRGCRGPCEAALVGVLAHGVDRPPDRAGPRAVGPSLDPLREPNLPLGAQQPHQADALQDNSCRPSVLPSGLRSSAALRRVRFPGERSILRLATVARSISSTSSQHRVGLGGRDGGLGRSRRQTRVRTGAFRRLRLLQRSSVDRSLEQGSRSL
jgi:hypothetical protein